MIDLEHYKIIITNRLSELGARLHDIETELGNLKPSDLEEQAVDLEDDEVLEGLGFAAEKEVVLLKQALERINNTTYGICLECDKPISSDRLTAVPYAPLCKMCVSTARIC